jgi:molybdopterin molybdotransferase
VISFDEALASILSCAGPLGTIQVSIEQSDGYFLVDAVKATVPLPRFENSSVDGYGVFAEDTRSASPESPVRLQVVGSIAAGENSIGPLGRGGAFKIFTGGQIPVGVDAVIMREQVNEGEWISITQPAAPGMNVRRVGEEFQVGDQVLPSQALITPAVIGLLAQLGISSCVVHRKPSVALLITGSELIPASGPLESGQVYDSNSPALSAALRTSGVIDFTTQRIVDTPEALRQSMVQGLAGRDVIITVGGVSMGDRDFVRDVCVSLGIEQMFWQIAMKPGKPNYFGTYTSDAGQRKLVFGLPGNPVSALVSYLMLVRPALRKMMGERYVSPELISARLSSEVRKEKGKLEFTRGRLKIDDGDWVVKQVGRQGSHMLGGMTSANCLIHCPADKELIPTGETVFVQRSEW